MSFPTSFKLTPYSLIFSNNTFTKRMLYFILCLAFHLRISSCSKRPNVSDDFLEKRCLLPSLIPITSKSKAVSSNHFIILRIKLRKSEPIIFVSKLIIAKISYQMGYTPMLGITIQSVSIAEKRPYHEQCRSLT